MNRHVTVTLVSVTETTDALGNVTETTTSADYDAVRFAPRSSTESTDNDRPRIISGAFLYRRGEFPATQTDRIIIADQHPLMDGTWQVDGESARWATGVEVPIKRTA